MRALVQSAAFMMVSMLTPRAIAQVVEGALVEPAASLIPASFSMFISERATVARAATLNGDTHVSNNTLELILRLSDSVSLIYVDR